MNRYPRLSQEAYDNPQKHREEIIKIIVESAVDCWQYYSRSLTLEEIEKIRQAINDNLPEKS